MVRQNDARSTNTPEATTFAPCRPRSGISMAWLGSAIGSGLWRVGGADNVFSVAMTGRVNPSTGWRPKKWRFYRSLPAPFKEIVPAQPGVHLKAD